MFAGAPFPFPTRAADSHKGTFGHVLVIAGSPGMSGAAFLAGKSALRTGAGLVTIACPESIHSVLEIKTTCVMTRPLPTTGSGALGRAALEPLRALIGGKAAVALGPGLGRDPETVQLVRDLLADWPEEAPPAVVDADGLNACEGRAEALAALEARGVLTPHPGELRRLCGPDADLAGDREGTLARFVARVGVLTLLKGHHTLVEAPAGEAGGEPRRYRNLTGNPGMASGGTGDVLTGIIAGLLAQGLPPFEAACLGAWLHGRAGDIAARTRGLAPLIATDLLDGLCEAIRAVEVGS